MLFAVPVHMEATVARNIESKSLIRIGAVDAFIVAQPSLHGPVVGTIITQTVIGDRITYATLFDAVRCVFMRGFQEGIGGDGSLDMEHKRTFVRLADAISRGFEPGTKCGLSGPSSRKKARAVATEKPTNRPILRMVPSGGRSDGPMTPADLLEKQRDADVALSIPCGSPLLVALIAETRRSLRAVQVCDSAVDALVKDRFLKGLRVPEQKRRALAVSLSALRAEVTGLDAAPFLNFRHRVCGSIADAAEAALADRPEAVNHMVGILRFFIALQRVRVSVEIERIRCQILATKFPGPDPSDHDRALLLKREVEAILCAGGITPVRRSRIDTVLQGVVKAVQFLEFDRASHLLGTVATMLE